MKTTKKLLSFLLILAVSFYALPTVWAEDLIQQPQDIPGNSYTDTEETDPPQIEEDINTDTEETNLSQNGENLTDIAADSDISATSLLPMEVESVDVLIDRTKGFPQEIEGESKYSFLVREVLSGVLEEKGIITDSEEYEGIVMYSYTNNHNSYEIIGWNDIITLDYRSGYVYFTVGGDQLDIDSLIYRINIKFQFIVDVVKNSTFNIFNEKGEPIDIYAGSVSDEMNSSGNCFTASYIVSDHVTDKNENLGFLITLPEGYSEENVEIYEGLIHNDTELGSAENIASKIISNGTEKPPYKMDLIDNSEESVLHGNLKNLTFVLTAESGNKLYFPVKYSVIVFSNSVIFNLTGYTKFMSVKFSDNTYFTSIKAAEATDFSKVNAYVKASYYDYSDNNAGVSKIDFACFGYYDSKEDALKANERDIKKSLFGSTGQRVNFEKCGDITAYLSDNTEIKVKSIQVTVVDIYGKVYHWADYFGIYEKSTSTTPITPPTPPTPSNSTYFSVLGANSQSDESGSIGKYLNSYTIPYDDDSYSKRSYQTLFILNKGNPVTDNVIYPVFDTTANKIFAADFSGGNTEQESGKSPLEFVSGRAVQYSATSESGKYKQNYWVTFVTQQRGPKLFVNATNNPDHYSNGKPQRVVYLNSKYDYHHDIFFANIGDEELTGINVSLSDNAQGVRLDDYWTVIDSSVGKLAPFTKTYNPDNIAKVRLVPVDDDKFGAISGTLTISAANGDSVDIELTGVAGVPKIVTDNLYDGVKYVPYSCVIMTNSMGDSDAMKFSVSSGALPSGMKLLENGELYGVPTESGEFTFTVKGVYSGAKQEDGSEYLCFRTYTLVINDNTDENVDAVNSDRHQGYPLTEKVSKYITVYYSSENGGIPVVEEIEMESDLFWSEGSYSDEFLAFYIDGILLEKNADYTAEEGSTKITVRDQTFGHIVMTGSDIPHTLAAEFRTEGKTKDLKRSAQNVYLEYIHVDSPDVPDNPDDPNEPNEPNKPGNNPDVNRPSDSNNNQSTNSFDINNISGSVNTTMTIVDTNGDPIPELSVELHSTPMYAQTNSSGTVKFDSVEFGRHKLVYKGSVVK